MGSQLVVAALLIRFICAFYFIKEEMFIVSEENTSCMHAFKHPLEQNSYTKIHNTTCEIRITEADTLRIYGEASSADVGL
jgi:hypothetical protein